MKKLPAFLKVSYREEIFKVKPVPDTFDELRESVSELVPNAPHESVYSYTDDSGDLLKVYNTKGLHTYYSDLDTSPNLILVLQPNYEELVQNAKTPVTLKSNEEDIVNLTLLGVVHLNKDLLNSIKYVQTDFAKKVISDILGMVKDSSIEEVANKFGISWEVIFYMTQEPYLSNHKASKKVSYTKVKNIFRPSKCLEIVKEFLAGKVSKEDILRTYSINDETFDLWIRLFKDPVAKPMELSHIQNKEKLKLLSCYLTGKISIDELEYAYRVTEAQINSWAIYFSQEQKVYQRERVITAEEKYDVLQRYFKGEYTVSQFQNDYGIRANLLYRWVRQVQSGRPLTSSNIFRTASDELEQAYNIFLDMYKD